MKINRLTHRLIAAAICLSAAGAWAYIAYFRHNPAASCSNCRRFVSASFDQYAMEHDGWYPRGEATPVQSFALLLKLEPGREDGNVHLYTSHALTDPARDYYRKTGTLSENITCYRYNEGLRAGDPGNLVMLYYYEPTRWECCDPRHKVSEQGRNVLSPGGEWEFVPEADFLRRQAATLDFLKQRSAATDATR